MKKIGKELTIRGKTTFNTNGELIRLWDGDWTTAYKILKFSILPSSPTTNTEIMGKLHYNPSTQSISAWNLTHNEEFAWAGWFGASTQNWGLTNGLVDAENMAVKDIYFSNYATTDTGAVNYLIIAQKYKVAEWDGALYQTRQLSQGGPQ